MTGHPVRVSPRPCWRSPCRFSVLSALEYIWLKTNAQVQIQGRRVESRAGIDPVTCGKEINLERDVNQLLPLVPAFSDHDGPQRAARRSPPTSECTEGLDYRRRRQRACYCSPSPPLRSRTPCLLRPWKRRYRNPRPPLLQCDVSESYRRFQCNHEMGCREQGMLAVRGAAVHDDARCNELRVDLPVRADQPLHPRT